MGYTQSYAAHVAVWVSAGRILHFFLLCMVWERKSCPLNTSELRKKENIQLALRFSGVQVSIDSCVRLISLSLILVSFSVQVSDRIFLWIWKHMCPTFQTEWDSLKSLVREKSVKPKPFNFYVFCKSLLKNSVHEVIGSYKFLSNSKETRIQDPSNFAKI